MGNKLVSFLIPAYNHEKYISDCIESVLQQTYNGSMEFLLCDDMSADKTYEVAKGYENRLKNRCENVVIIRNEKNLGICGNLNRLLSLANGDYIKVFAGDDYLDADYLKSMIEYIDSNGIDLAFCNGNIVDASSHLHNDDILSIFYKDPPQINNETIFNDLYVKGSFLLGPSFMMTRQAFDVCGLYDSSMYIEDWDYWLNAAHKGMRFGYLDRVLVNYRKTPGAMSSGIGDGADEKCIKLYHGEQEIVEKYSHYFDKNTLSYKEISLIISKERVAYINGLDKAKNYIKDEYDKFDKWGDLRLKDRVILKTRHLLRFLNPYL